MKRNRSISRAAWIATALFVTACGLDMDSEQPATAASKGPSAVLFNLNGPLPEFSGPEELFTPDSQNQYDLLKLMRKAVYDLNVQEIVVHIGAPSLSLARASEVVAALKQITAAGKPLTCHFDSADNIAYFIAAAGCPKILISPAGSVEALGLAAEPLFIREFLAGLGISADMLHIGRYKDAAEPMMRDSMSEESRESLGALLQELHRIFKDGISTGRKLSPEKVQTLIDGGPYDAKESLSAKLVDEIRPLSAFLGELRQKYAGGVDAEYGKTPPKQMSFTELMKMFGAAEPKKEKSKADHIALVPVVGEIMSGESNDFMGGDNVYDMSLIQTLDEVREDDAVKAVVLRIDSPGGSALASDNIWHAVRALAAKKPVIASMGDVAASGGYYIASAATEVLSIPATITGSIGVVGGKIVFSEAANKWGITPERLQTGARAALGSPFSPFSDEERTAVTRLMQSAYDMFVDRVTEGRGLERAKVLEVAEGRVWTGTQAKEFGLVTRLGSLDDAVNRAREVAEVPAGTPVEIVPKPKNLMDLLGEAFSEPQASAALQLAKRVPEANEALTMTNLLMQQRVLAVLPWVIRVH